MHGDSPPLWNSYRRPSYWKWGNVHLLPCSRSLLWDRKIEEFALHPATTKDNKGAVFKLWTLCTYAVRYLYAAMRWLGVADIWVLWSSHSLAMISWCMFCFSIHKVAVVSQLEKQCLSTLSRPHSLIQSSSILHTCVILNSLIVSYRILCCSRICFTYHIHFFYTIFT